jgi:hypothetical protein
MPLPGLQWLFLFPTKSSAAPTGEPPRSTKGGQLLNWDIGLAFVLALSVGISGYCAAVVELRGFRQEPIYTPRIPPHMPTSHDSYCEAAEEAATDAEVAANHLT